MLREGLVILYAGGLTTRSQAGSPPEGLCLAEGDCSLVSGGPRLVEGDFALDPPCASWIRVHSGARRGSLAIVQDRHPWL
jgi:hypothetical protein